MMRTQGSATVLGERVVLLICDGCGAKSTPRKTDETDIDKSWQKNTILLEDGFIERPEAGFRVHYCPACAVNI